MRGRRCFLRLHGDKDFSDLAILCDFFLVGWFSLPETNSIKTPEMDDWNTCFLLGWPIFGGYVSFGEGK